MAFKQFWQNVRTGASFLSPSVSVDSARLDPQNFSSMLERADIYLTPHTVANFDEQDFRFLPEGDQERLTTAVRQFLSVAENVPNDGPATEEQSLEGRRSFAEILSIMRPDKYLDAEAFVIGKLLEHHLDDKFAERRC